MDGKGRCFDNIFIERLWRPLKYECVYLHAWEAGSQAKAGIGRWIAFHNHRRPHAAHGGQLPAVAYWTSIETDQRGQRAAQLSRKPVQGLGRSSYEAGRSMAVSIYNGNIPVQSARVKFQIKPDGPNKTTLSAAVEFKMKMGILGSAIIPLAKKQMGNDIAKLLKSNKDFVESRAI